MDVSDHRVVRISELEGTPALTPIDILVVNKKLFVHHPDGLHISARNVHGRTTDARHLALNVRYVRHRVTRLIVSKQSRSAEKRNPTQATPGLDEAVRNKDQSTTNHPIIAFFLTTDERSERVRLRKCIGIEHPNSIPRGVRRCHNARIYAAGISEVLGTLQQCDRLPPVRKQELDMVLRPRNRKSTVTLYCALTNEARFGEAL